MWEHERTVVLRLCSLYRVAFASERKSYLIGLLFELCFGAISVTERSCSAQIPKMKRHISDRLCATL